MNQKLHSFKSSCNYFLILFLFSAANLFSQTAGASWNIKNPFDANDLFTVKTKGIKKLEVEIYDRWGVKLYEWNTVDGGWDGKNSSTGKLCPDGTYYYNQCHNVRREGL
jgi:gliding motility-associated-like protein